jgi:hypothetical protein
MPNDCAASALCSHAGSGAWPATPAARAAVWRPECRGRSHVSARAPEPAYAAAGWTDITPLAPVPLAGYAARTQPFSGVRDPLEANVLWLKQGREQVVFVQVDALSAGMWLRRSLLSRLGGLVRDEQLVLVASHTHFAPATDPGTPDLGTGDAAYCGMVAEHVGDLVASLSRQAGTAVDLHRGAAMADHSVNRRRLVRRRVRSFPYTRLQCELRPAFAGPRDENVWSLRLSCGPSIVAVAWGYACHPVGQPCRTMVSADYPGEVRRVLRETYGPQIPVLFLPGFSGDTRPKTIARPSTLTGRLRHALRGPTFGPFTEDGYLDWGRSLASVVVSAAAQTSHALSPDLRVARTVMPMRELATGWGDERELALQLVQLSPDWLMACISAEPVTEYRSALAGALGRPGLVPVGYLDSVVGYLPAAHMLGHGGIETTSTGYGWGAARVRPDAEAIVSRAFRALLAGLADQCDSTAPDGAG